MTIQLNYNQYSLMGRLKFSVDYKDLLSGYKRCLFPEETEGKQSITFISKYGTEIYYKGE